MFDSRARAQSDDNGLESAPRCPAPAEHGPLLHFQSLPKPRNKLWKLPELCGCPLCDSNESKARVTAASESRATVRLDECPSVYSRCGIWSMEFFSSLLWKSAQALHRTQAKPAASPLPAKR